MLSCPHFKISIRKRSKQQSAVAGAAYQSGEKLFSQYDFKTKNYQYKLPEVIYKEILLPSNAPQEYKDRETLWNAAEKIEKQWNAQLSRGIVLALPRELPREQYVALVRDYCTEQFVSKGMCVDVAIHDKGDGNPHAHIMLTMRAMDENGKWLPKSRKVYELDENGEKILLPSGEPKSHKENTVDWNEQSKAELWRNSWAETVNRYFDKNGISEHLDLRSYERQGIDIVPTVHLGAAVTHMEKKGIATELGDYNRQIKSHNAMVSRLRKLVVSIEQWLHNTKEKISQIFEEDPPKPTLISLLQQYSAIRTAERKDWHPGARQKAQIQDLQFNAKALVWMQQNNILSLDDFENLIAQKNPILQKISMNDKEIKKLSKAIDYLTQFKKLKPIYDKSKTGFKFTQEKYALEHKDELEAFKKTVRYLKANHISTDEYDSLKQKRESIRTENRILKAELNSNNLDVDMISQIQYRVTKLLENVETLPKEERASILQKLREPIPQAEKKDVDTRQVQTKTKTQETSIG